jgi:hypothetical protein
MKPRKPDRFERAVSRIAKSDEDVGYTDFCFSCNVVELLRKEHAWMRRMVKRIDAWACQELADNDDVIAEILKQLAQRRK